MAALAVAPPISNPPPTVVAGAGGVAPGMQALESKASRLALTLAVGTSQSTFDLEGPAPTPNLAGPSSHPAAGVDASSGLGEGTKCAITSAYRWRQRKGLAVCDRPWGGAALAHEQRCDRLREAALRKQAA